MAIPNGGRSPRTGGLAHTQRIVGIIATVVKIIVTLGGFYLALSNRGGQSTLVLGVAATATIGPTATATPLPVAPTSVTLNASVANGSATTQRRISVPSGETILLSVIPNHSLVPFQTFTMGIYAEDPYGFSELQDCTYPNTSTCTYTVAYSSGANTDYTRGTHTFSAFLGSIGGAILENSNEITITWT